VPGEYLRWFVNFTPAMERIDNQSYRARIQAIADIPVTINGAQYCSRDVGNVLPSLYDAERFFTYRYQS